MRLFARRLFLVGAVLAALALVMTPALASADDDDDDDGGGGDRAFCAPAGPPDPSQCSVSVVAGTARFDFDASSGPLGENPTGTFRFEVPTMFSGPQFWEGQVTCLRVTGNRAAIGGVVTNASPAGLVGRGLAFSVLDNTPSSQDLLFEGTFLVSGPPPANAPDCGNTGEPFSPVTGDIVVQDNIAGGGGDDDDDDDDGDDDDDDGDDDDDDDGGGDDDDDDD